MLIPEVLTMNREELNKLLAQLHGELQELDLRERVDEASEEYDRWAEEHEELEDQIDDVLDQLDAL